MMWPRHDRSDRAGLGAFHSSRTPGTAVTDLLAANGLSIAADAIGCSSCMEDGYAGWYRRYGTHPGHGVPSRVPPPDEGLEMLGTRAPGGSWELARDMSDRGRPPHRLVGLVEGRWTLAVLAELAGHGRRYQDLHDSLEGISHKVLTDTLRRAERDGLVTRHLDPGRVDTATLYELTDLGRSLDEPLAALGQWVDAKWDLVDAARRRWDVKADGR